jgi:outer membrane protein assembly factor BamB
LSKKNVHLAPAAGQRQECLMHTAKRIVIGSIVFVMCLCGQTSAQGTMGDGISGFRGDGTGSFPSSHAPFQWQRVSKLMAGARCQLNKPADDKAGGESVSNGLISQWLVIGGFVPKNEEDPETALDEQFVEEATVQPSEGDKVGDLAWKKVDSVGCYLDFEAALPKPKPKEGFTAYAHAYVYCETGGQVVLRFASEPASGLKAWVNGKQVAKRNTPGYDNNAGWKAEFTKGWNRLLVKVVRGRIATTYVSPWKMMFMMYVATPCEYAPAKNVQWVTRIPGGTCTSDPVVVGDKIITMADPGEVVCVSKKDGKLLWIRPVGQYEGLSAEARESAPFKDIAPLAKRVDEINKEFCSGKDNPALAAEKMSLQYKILDAMKKADPKKYNPEGPRRHPGICTPTPCSDGKNIYVWMGSLNVAASLDLEGKIRWIRDGFGSPAGEHGDNSSPVLAGGRMLVYHSNDRNIFALDMETGKDAWKISHQDLVKINPKVFYEHFAGAVNGSGTPYVFKVQGKQVVMYKSLIVRPENGDILWTPPTFQDMVMNCSNSGVVSDGKLYVADDGIAGNSFTVTQLPTSFEADGKLKVRRLGRLDNLCGSGAQNTGETFCASVLVHKGYAYLVDMVGRIQVIDARDPAKMTVVHKVREISFPQIPNHVYWIGSCFASPILLGDKVCFTGTAGLFQMYQPGADFKLVTVNRLECELPAGYAINASTQEMFTSSPIVDGDRIYIRGDGNLYCVGAK